MLFNWQDIQDYEFPNVLAEFDAKDLSLLRSFLVQVLLEPSVYFVDYEGNEDEIDEFLSQYLEITS